MLPLKMLSFWIVSIVFRSKEITVFENSASVTSNQKSVNLFYEHQFLPNLDIIVLKFTHYKYNFLKFEFYVSCNSIT